MDYEVIIRQVLISAIPILFAIVLHEVAHGYVAYRLGDPTAKVMGRLSLNPIPHIDIVGTILMPLMLFVFTSGQFVIGYAKPVPINPSNFKNPKRDMAISAAFGPITNLILAVLSFLILKYVLLPISATLTSDLASNIIKPLILMVTASVTINVILATFNMLPIPPLDGGRVLMGILPYRQSLLLGKIEPYGFLIVILLVVLGISSYIVVPIARLFLSLIRML
ncbi:MAG: site-2 protease family protein [Thermodesulfovibrionales bacterium]|nr:site-2 protease family protein [Thermodesulfovibrionales bacterium]